MLTVCLALMTHMRYDLDEVNMTIAIARLAYILHNFVLFFSLFCFSSFITVPRRRNSLNIKHPIWAKIILAFHILVGLAVSSLGLWLCWWAPSTRSRDNPYWSGLIVSEHTMIIIIIDQFDSYCICFSLQLMLSGILGFVLFGFRRIPRHKLREHLFKFFYLNSTLVTVVAALCTLTASLFATYHIVQIFTYGHQCGPAIVYTTSSPCICNYSNSNSTHSSRLQAQSESEVTIAPHEFYYRWDKVTGTHYT